MHNCLCRFALGKLNSRLAFSYLKCLLRCCMRIRTNVQLRRQYSQLLQKSCGLAWTLKQYPPMATFQFTMGVKTITRLPKIIGELFFGISGNDYLCQYLWEILGELFFGTFRQFKILLPVAKFLLPKSCPNSKIIWGVFYFCFRPALSSSFLPLACTLSAPSRGTQHHPSMAFSPWVVALECAGKRPLFVYVKCGPFDVL